MRVLSLFVIIAALACSRRATRGTKLDSPRESITDSVAAWVVDSLTLDATRMDFFALPDSVVPGSPLCP